MTGLEGKVAVVTGAARMRGIGRAIAVRLAREGADVAVSGVARPPESFPEEERRAGWRGLPSLCEEIEALGRRALAVEADVSRKEDVARMVGAAREAFGRIDILVNNAGLAFCGEHPLWEIEDEEWYRVVDVNLNGVYLCCRAVISHMIEAGRGGRIINLSSLSGRTGVPYYGAYIATKAAVVGLTQMLALELAPYQITANAVAPGSTDTDMMDGTFRRMAARAGTEFQLLKAGVTHTIPLGRQGRAEDIAGAVAFLASDDAAWVTGQCLDVNGGALMR
jgi:NAD(P)-dependent dehydrogenase (short-subunit alcohol dehydrogenase family)